MSKKITAREQRFVDEYLVDLDATKAAIRASYSAKTASQMGYELLQRPRVQEAVTAAMSKRSHRTNITADRVLQELGRIAFFDIRNLYHEGGRLKLPEELDDDTAAALASVEILETFEGTGEDREHIGDTKKVKASDKVQALSLAMRHLGMLNDKLHITRPKVTIKDLTGRKDA